MAEFFVLDSSVFIKLLLALVLGMLIGTERLLSHKTAGMKTHALVAMGSALFIIISDASFLHYGAESNFDPSRVISQIVVGIGFLGAGSIIFKGHRLVGLTTAAGLWVTAGVGAAVGFGLYPVAIWVTIFVLAVYIVMSIFERPVRKLSNKIDQNNDDD